MTFPTQNVAELIVCEHDGRWAARLRRRLGTSRLRIHQTRSPLECRAALHLARSSVVILEWTRSSAAEVVDLVADFSRIYTEAIVILVGDRSQAEWYWLAIEAGATASITSPRELSNVITFIRNHLDRVVTAPVTTREKIMDSLPWKEVATST